MLRSAVSTFLVLGVIALMSSIPSASSLKLKSTANDEPVADSQAFQIYTDVSEDDTALGYDDSSAVTPYDYKALMLQNSKADGRKVLCWRCGSPCSAGFCCDDGYPKCCIRNGRCRCCRR